MVHYSCDRCSKSLLSGEDSRYVVRIEVYAAHEPAELGEVADSDHLDELSEYLDEIETGEPGAVPAPAAPQILKFDLCAACRKKFLKDPLSREAVPKLKFSKN